VTVTSSDPDNGPAVHYAAAGGVATLTMNEVRRRNALTPALLTGLGHGLQAAQTDPTVRVTVLTHNGPVFCAGADISGAPAPKREPVLTLAEILATIQDSPKPVVARIGGHCLGGGVGLAAACDISIAADDAGFGFTEVRLGVAPAIVSVVCLPKLRRADALRLFLTGERIPATEAAAVGLITAVVAPAGLEAAVDHVLGQLLAGGPQALAAAKRLVFTVPEMERSAAFAHTTALSEVLFASDEAAEGMAAFRSRRPPAWAPKAGHET
jgi:methylglutaconyl-CoA hydratase